MTFVVAHYALSGGSKPHSCEERAIGHFHGLGLLRLGACCGGVGVRTSGDRVEHCPLRVVNSRQRKVDRARCVILSELRLRDGLICLGLCFDGGHVGVETVDLFLDVALQGRPAHRRCRFRRRGCRFDLGRARVRIRLQLVNASLDLRAGLGLRGGAVVFRLLGALRQILEVARKGASWCFSFVSL